MRCVQVSVEKKRGNTRTHKAERFSRMQALTTSCGVQCRQENKSVRAQIVDSPDFCHSSHKRDQTKREKKKRSVQLKTWLSWTRGRQENTHTRTTLLGPSVHPPELGCFYHPRFSKGEILLRDSVEIVAEKFGHREGNEGTGAPLLSEPGGPALDETSLSR